MTQFFRPTNLAVPRITGAVANRIKSKLSAKGKRIFAGRLGTFNNATQTTFHIAAALPCHFDAIAPIFANTDAAKCQQVAACKVSVVASKDDLNNSAGTWLSILDHGNSVFQIPKAKSSNRVLHYIPDHVVIKSLDRTDLIGAPPIVLARCVFSNAANIPVYGNGSDNLTSWAVRDDEMIWISRSKTGDHVNTLTGFDSVTNISQNPIVGFEFISRSGKVMNIGAAGDSLVEGRGTYIGEGHIGKAAMAMNDTSGISVAYSNFGWSGVSSTVIAGHFNRAIDIMRGPTKPDVMVVQFGSTNDSSALTDSNVLAWFYGLERFLDVAAEEGVIPVITTLLPANSPVAPSAGTKVWGTADQKRVEANKVMMTELKKRGFSVIDITRNMIGGVDSSGQEFLASQFTADGIHLNDAAINRIAEDEVIRGISEALGVL